MKLNAVLLLWATLLRVEVDGYRILCVFTIPTKSHNILGKGVVRALLNAGHQVTWVTPYPLDAMPAKNLTVIDSSATVPLSKGMSINDLRLRDVNQIRTYSMEVTAVTFQTPELRRVLVEEQFDAVVSEWFFTDAHAGIAAIQEVPWILLSPLPMHIYLEYLVDEIRSAPILPVMNTNPVPLNFFQRLANCLVLLALQHGIWTNGPETAEFYRSIFNPLAAARGVTLPPFEEALHNVSILLVNSHPSYYYAQSLPPNVIEVGGFHIDEDIPPLPKDLQELLDSSPQGVIYFSLGSVVSSSSLSEQTKRDIIKILGQLPHTVLWKFEEKFEDLPKNVHIRPWMPQLSILSHPNVKLFITHGGLLSTIEALNFGVPLVMVPVFGDQPTNAARAVRAGYAAQVPYAEDMGQDLGLAIKEVLGNPRYAERIKHHSKMFHTRHLSPAKLISYNVKLAIETKGAYHLRSKAPLYTWYQRFMIDQLAFLFAILYVVYRLVKKVVQMGLAILMGLSKSKTKQIRQKVKKN